MIFSKTKDSFCAKRKRDCFDYLKQFIGKKLSIRERGKQFRVCTKYSRQILLTSDKSIERVVHLKAKECDFRFRNHIGHNLRCVGYGNGNIQNISIECEDCCSVLYDVEAN